MTRIDPAAPNWLRRNAVALIVVAVLLPVTAAAVSLNAWQDLLATTTTTVPSGETVRFGTADVGDARARFDGTVDELPQGTRVVATQIDIDPRGEDFTCFAPVLRETTGAGREWNDSTSSLDRPYNPDRVTYCTSDEHAPYTLEVDYLVPDDADGPFVLELSSSSVPSEKLLLAVAP